jgi:hypothetical protein
MHFPCPWLEQEYQGRRAYQIRSIIPELKSFFVGQARLDGGGHFLSVNISTLNRFSGFDALFWRPRPYGAE